MAAHLSSTINWRKIGLSIAGIIAALLCVAIVLAGALPVGLLKPLIEDKISTALATEVSIGSVAKDSIFSFTPRITVTNLRIKQPTWAGEGDFVTAQSLNLRLSIWDVLTGNVRPSGIKVKGVKIALIRDRNGRANWEGKNRHNREGDNRKFTDRSSNPFSDISVSDVSVSLNDLKRDLKLSGTVKILPSTGLAIAAQGSFLGTAAKLYATGAPPQVADVTKPYPFNLSLASPALTLKADGTMNGLLNTRNFDVKIRASAPTLKNLDRIIEAGLFGTQPINLTASVHHEGSGWDIKSLQGAIGRSQLTGFAAIRKRNGRTKINGKIAASQFDFDDLADDAGQARGAALRARLGPRIVPNTRINLSKIGKTDIAMDFTVSKLLARNGSVFQSLKAKATLDHKILSVTNIQAKMDEGQMTGNMRVDHRSGSPKLTTRLRFTGASLAFIFGNPEIVDGPVTGIIALSGSGDTIREALTRANGKVGMVAMQGTMKATIADVLGQDLGKTIAQIIRAPSERDPLNCMIASFQARNGILAPMPLVISAGSSVGRGNGRIIMDGERVELTLRGAAQRQSGLRIMDPIRINGTLSAPKVMVAGLNSKTKPTLGRALKILGKSFASALGLNKAAKNQPEVKSVPQPVNCRALSENLLS